MTLVLTRHRKVLFFSRGRGKGHVLPDLSIAQELRSRCDADITMVSYGTGYKTLSSRGECAYDLEMPDNNRFLDAIVKATRLALAAAPDLIIAHEEFAALIAADTCRKPAVFITDWFPDPDHIWTQALGYATETIFIETPGKFTEPPSISAKVRYVGPLLRSLKCDSQGREDARQRLSIRQDEVLILCLPGTTYEQSSPIAKLLFSAYDALDLPKKRLVWIGEADHDKLMSYVHGREDVVVMTDVQDVEWLMVAADVVVTKGTRNTLRELQKLSVPSITLSHGRNWPDDVIGSRISTNTMLDATKITSNALADFLARAITTPRIPQPEVLQDGLVATVQCLLEHIASA